MRCLAPKLRIWRPFENSSLKSSYLLSIFQRGDFKSAAKDDPILLKQVSIYYRHIVMNVESQLKKLPNSWGIWSNSGKTRGVRNLALPPDLLGLKDDLQRPSALVKTISLQSRIVSKLLSKVNEEI